MWVDEAEDSAADDSTKLQLNVYWTPKGSNCTQNFGEAAAVMSSVKYNDGSSMFSLTRGTMVIENQNFCSSTLR